MLLIYGGVHKWGYPPIFIHFWIGFSRTKTIQLCGYPHDYGNPHFQIPGNHGLFCRYRGVPIQVSLEPIQVSRECGAPVLRTPRLKCQCTCRPSITGLEKTGVVLEIALFRFPSGFGWCSHFRVFQPTRCRSTVNTFLHTATLD